MKKLISTLILLSIIGIAFIPASKAYATDNATIIDSDNFTANVTITSLPALTITGTTDFIDAITGLTDEIDDSNDLTGALIAILLSFGIAAFLLIIAVWRRTWLFYILAGFAWLLLGFQYMSTDVYGSILMALVGLGCFTGAKFDR